MGEAIRGRRTLTSASELRGVFPAIFTPLKDDDPKRLRNSIDYDKAKRIIDDLIREGVDGLVPVGTTGQSPTVSPAQHLDFVRFTVDYADGRVPVIAGAGSNCTRESIVMIEELQKVLGTMAVLCVTGYYNNPTQEGLKAHFKLLSSETAAKIVIYNVPGRTASYLEPETILELAEDANIIGLKQAVDFKNPGKHRDDTARIIKSVSHDRLAVVSGEDDALQAILELGGSGIITASGNIPEAARAYIAMCKAFKQGNPSESARLQESLLPLIKGVFCRKNPIPLGTFFNSPLFLPLVSLSEMAGGEALVADIHRLIREAAPSLLQYQNGK